MIEHAFMRTTTIILALASFSPLGCGSDPRAVDVSAMSFFATSEGSGSSGGDLGGLAGADATCQRLADAAGSTKTWKAYLCASTEDARDRIGSGPWVNVFGDEIATSPTTLHQDGVSNDSPQRVYTELGDKVPSAQHDILTGCNEDGTVRVEDETCADWTSADSADKAYVGHSEKPAPPNQDFTSWNSQHASACDEQGLIATKGSGRLYCFAL